MNQLLVQPLTQQAFAAFGDVIELSATAQKHEGISINDGTALRYDDLSRLDTTAEGGNGAISLFVAQPRELPVQLTEFERHPLGSQAFIPLDNEAYLIVVASTHTPPGSPALSFRPHAFQARADQGINIGKSVWHHPLLAISKPCRFLVIDRVGAGNNLQVSTVAEQNWLVAPARSA